jgi:hypothetical protein
MLELDAIFTIKPIQLQIHNTNGSLKEHGFFFALAVLLLSLKL